MTTTAIRQKLYDYIRGAEDRKIKAIYTMLQEEIEETYAYWDDKRFLAELKRRSADRKASKSNAVDWEETKEQILSAKGGKKTYGGL
ncbi:hypothetical protein [Flavihumibacter fluvii]|uniref:hypothetical protein n=1 Tax=Flavihumibacter fluvii TaxID=2838157 RepID=UPI001BDE90A9|nr:hypothetical protein [Flavihumibacter fluvii]ULQ51057.1 hypothetical protein KJS93_13280 [Flavihumibacter fluvii]